MYLYSYVHSMVSDIHWGPGSTPLWISEGHRKVDTGQTGEVGREMIIEVPIDVFLKLLVEKNRFRVFGGSFVSSNVMCLADTEVGSPGPWR